MNPATASRSLASSVALALVSLAAAPSRSGAEESTSAARPNVLFIAVDDLNHWVGHLGRHPQAFTPNLDRLAAGGVSFASAYCTAPACNPSRASLMSGLRPTSTGCYLNNQEWRAGIRDDQLINTQFLRAGYRVYGAGEIYTNLCSLAGLEPPAHLDGPDLAPLLKDPVAPWDLPALTTHGRGNHAIRLGPWRYIRYADGGEELYDHREDPLEYTNLAASPEHAVTKAELAAHLPAEEAPDLPR